MAIPIRAIPVLEGKVAERFERERKKAEKKQGSVDFSGQMESCRAILAKARRKGVLI